MAGAFSGHLLNTFNNAPQPNTPAIITSGAMSFDARAHGTPGPSFFSPPPMPNSLFGFTPLTEDSTSAKQIATLQAKLNKKLGPEYISQRPGPGGGQKLTYAEGWKIINLANEVFGFNGWSSNVVNITTDFVDFIEESRRFNVGVTAIVRVTLRDGAYHEDVGYGMLENAKSKAAALDKCKKEAITDALKRTLRNFGNLLGNCLYDKSYAQEIVKIKVPPAKFDKNDLYRRPEFEERIPDAPPPAPEEPRVKVEHEVHQPETPITYVPRHLRQEMAAAAQRAQAQTTARGPTTPSPGVPHAQPMASGSGSATNNPANRVLPSADMSKTNGLATPIQTPMQANPPPPRAPPPKPVATSPLSRIRSAPERRASSAEPAPAQIPARAESVDAADQDVDLDGQKNGPSIDNDEDEDLFPISTQDGAFFATVDLGEGDLGRPIDFDEGVGGISVMDASVLEQDAESGLLPFPEHLVRDRTGTEPRAGPSPGAASRPVQSIARVPAKSGGPPGNAALTSSTRPVTSTGEFNFSSGMKSAEQQYVPKPVPACGRTTVNPLQSGPIPGSLKRSADAMQVGSAPSTPGSSRPATQGMGLAQKQQQQNASARRPSDNSEGNDPKRFKR